MASTGGTHAQTPRLCNMVHILESMMQGLLWWANGISALLLMILYVALPFPNSVRLWPRQGNRLWWLLLLLATLSWNCFRFIVESITQIQVPRGFLDLSLVYLAIWCYTLGLGWNQDAKVYRIATTVLRALCRVHSVRVNLANPGIPGGLQVSSVHRSGHAEVVVRIGEASALWPWLVRRRIGQYNSGNAALVAGSPNAAMEQWSDAMIVWRWSWRPHFGITYWRGTEQRVLH
jgi:hypothetical protein